MKIEHMLEALSDKTKGQTALGVSVEGKQVKIRFGNEVEWIALDKAHLDIFIAMLQEKRKELP